MAKTREPEQCNAPGCTKLVKKKGLCAEHIRANYVLACTVGDCQHEMFAKGRCRAHYMRRYRKKNGAASPKPDEPVRGYGQARFEVFTRIPADAADVILKASGRRDGMYEKAAEILTTWASRHAG